MALLDTTGNAPDTATPKRRKLSKVDDPVFDLAGERIKEQLATDFTTPDAITEARLSEFGAQRKKAEAQHREDLNRLNILRGGGKTADVLGEFTAGTLRGEQDIKAQGIQRRQNAIQDAMNFATVGQAGVRLSEDVVARDRSQTEQERAAQAGERLSEAQIRGELEGQATIGGRAQTVEERRVAVQESQQTLSREIQTGQLNLARASEIFDQTFAQGKLTGVLNTVDPGRLNAFDAAFGAIQGDKNYDATLDVNSDGKVGLEDMVDFVEREGVGLSTLELQQMRQDAVEFDRQMNVAEADQKLTEEIQKGRLNLDRAGQIFNQTLAQGKFTGVLNTIDPARLSAFDAAFGTKEGEEGYNPALDATNDGWIGMEDMVAWVEQQGIAVPGVELQQLRQSAAQFDRQADLAETNAAIDRAVAEGRETGTYTDPETGKELTTLQAELSRRQQVEVERSAQAGERLTEGGLTGQITGGERLSDIATKARLGLPETVTIRELDRKALAAGFTKDFATGQYTAPTRETLASKATTSQIDLGERAMTIQESQQKYDQWKEVGTLTGELTLLDGEGNPVMRVNPKTGVEEPMTISTLAARDIALREGQAVGKVGDDPTVEQQALDLEEKIKSGTLALQTAAQTHGFNVDEATLTGVYKAMGTQETGQFMASMGKKLDGDEAGYNPRYDFNGDGTVDQVDYIEFQRIADGDGATTLAGQKLAGDNASRTFQETMQKAGMLGRLGGETIVAERQRMFDNLITEANTFADVQPTSFTSGDFQSAAGAKKGDSNFRADLDLDGDGEITSADYVSMMSSGRATDENGDVVAPGEDVYTWEDSFFEAAFNSKEGDENYNERYDMNGDGEIGFTDRVAFAQAAKQEPTDRAFVYQPEGKRTALAAKLGIEERQLTESVRQMDTQIDNASAQWQSMFSGVMVNEDGSPNRIWDPEEQTWRQPTSLEREAHEQNVIIFNDRMEQDAGSLAGRLGLIPDNRQAVEVAWEGLFAREGARAVAKTRLNERVIATLQNQNIEATPENIQSVRLALMQSALLDDLPEEQRVAIAGTMAQVMFGSQFNVQYGPESGLGAAVAGAIGTAAGAFLGK